MCVIDDAYTVHVILLICISLLTVCRVVTGVGCSVVGAPDHGMVSQTGIAADSEVNYSCRQGFTLTGNRTRQCSEQGLWSGSQPLCTGR